MAFREFWDGMDLPITDTNRLVLPTAYTGHDGPSI